MSLVDILCFFKYYKMIADLRNIVNVIGISVCVISVLSMSLSRRFRTEKAPYEVSGLSTFGVAFTLWRVALFEPDVITRWG